MLSKSTIKTMRKEVSSYNAKLASVFDVLSDTNRLKMFQLLLKHNNLCVTDVAGIFDVSIPAASQQLKIMELNGLVKKERDGQMICYSVDKKSPLVKSIQKVI